MTKEDQKFFNTKFDKIDNRFDKIEQRLDKIENRLDKVESRLDNLEEWTELADKKFDLIEKKFVEVDNRFDKLEKYVTTRFAEIEEKVEEFLIEMDTLTQISQLHTIKIGRIETGYNLKDK
jgi:predicted  nucleic acid-binding Zn-ribbon protein